MITQDSARLLTRACIALKNKQTEVVNENSKNLNQMKLMFWHVSGDARHRWEKMKK